MQNIPENSTNPAQDTAREQVSTEQHLDIQPTDNDNLSEPDVVNQPENHISKEEFEARETGQKNSSSIPPPDDAPRGL